MANVQARYRDAIGPLIGSFRDELILGTAKSRPNFKRHLRSVGELMVRYVKESMVAQRGVANGKPYAPLSPKYAKWKVAHGGSAERVLYHRGRLANSWRITVNDGERVVVGAGGGAINADKAAGHDGGLADALGRPELNRLQIGFSDKMADEINVALWDAILAAVERKSPKKGR